MAKKYDPKKIEGKWQKYWQKKKTYKTTESGKEKCYVLDMFPYPSGEGLHVGHPRGYIATDVYSRYKKMQGHDVLHPMGWDAFGLPAENFAIKNKIHPEVSVKKNIKRFKEQLSIMGFNYDWEREFSTTDPDYYRWTQWCFLQMYKAGLAYESHEPINWCPSCKTGLANEDVENGRCERCGTLVEKKPLRQWMIKITKYADRLLEDLKYLKDWPASIIEAQKNWIGRSEGAEIEFKIKYDPPLTLPQGEGMDGYKTTNSDAFAKLHEQAVKMRQNPTEAENILWQKLRGDTAGHHFRRQQIIGNFIVDFVCLSKNLVIEVDGDIHDLQKERDEERTRYLQAHGFKVLRFQNNEVVKDTEIVFKKILNSLSLGEGRGEVDLGRVKVFTTRADTIFGATYLVLAPEHDLLMKIKDKISNWQEVAIYIERSGNKSDLERTGESKEKTGVELRGVIAINPANGEELPIWVADYILASYGTGAIMAVPQHDERDKQFAEKYKLPIVDKPLIPIDEAQKKFGKMVTKYKLRDWVFSRQRYWGEPIPLIHCDKCGVVPVPEKDLPVKLPKVKHYEPTGTGESPLASIDKWVNVKCPTCGGKAKRETNTMPQWAGSSWYYLRFIDPKNKKALIDKEKEKSWMPVSLYVGGAEHATRHLIYARFWHKFLYDIDAISTTEPFKRLHSVGLIAAEDGRKMSKRYGNVVNPDDVIATYGADTFRLYEMFMGPFSYGIAWKTDNMIGSRRFLERVWGMQEFIKENEPKEVTMALHKTIKKVEEDIESFSFNTAVSAMMIFVNEVYEKKSISKDSFASFTEILAPFAPHIAEELWSALGQKGSIHLALWPSWDPNLIKSDKVIIAVQINGKTRSEIEVLVDTPDEEVRVVALENEKVKSLIGGSTVQRVIVVKNRLINIVVPKA